MKSLAGGRAARGLRDDVLLVARGWRWGRRGAVPRSAEQFVQPRHTEPFPTAWARSRAASAVRSGIQVAGLRPVIRSSVKPTVHGLDVLDDLQGPVVFVANHTSHLDTPLILTSLPAAWRRRTSVAAAADYFFDTWWRATASAMVFNTFPIERRSGSLSSTPGSLLENGWSLVVFPEGTRSPDGWTRPFKHGAAFLSLRHKVPVVPIALRGSYAAMPRGRNWPVPGRQAVTVRFGRPLFPAEGEGPRDLGERVERAVAQLLDEDATTWWAAARRAADGTTPSGAAPDTAAWRRVWEQTKPPEVRTHRRVWR
ncbi:lysophospholipid acyltransferase family protein [Angustibacter aerolatus]